MTFEYPDQIAPWCDKRGSQRLKPSRVCFFSRLPEEGLDLRRFTINHPPYHLPSQLPDVASQDVRRKSNSRLDQMQDFVVGEVVIICDQRVGIRSFELALQPVEIQ